MKNIDDMNLEAYKKRIREDIDPRLVQLAIPTTATFELKGHILSAIKDIPFSGKDHEDAYKHFDEVNDITDYFNILNVPRETVLFRMLSVTFKGTTKDWLKALPPCIITIWAQMREEFI